jgi:hypothetical protein
VVAGVILLLLLAYPWFGCNVDRSEVHISLNKRWAIVTVDGSAVGLTFNVSNYASCELHLESVTVTVHSATYHDGSVHSLEFTEMEPSTKTISPGYTEEVDFTFEYIFPSSPVKLTLWVEMSLREVGPIVAFDGETEIALQR